MDTASVPANSSFSVPCSVLSNVRLINVICLWYDTLRPRKQKNNPFTLPFYFLFGVISLQLLRQLWSKSRENFTVRAKTKVISNYHTLCVVHHFDAPVYGRSVSHQVLFTSNISYSRTIIMMIYLQTIREIY